MKDEIKRNFDDQLTEGVNIYEDERHRRLFNKDDPERMLALTLSGKIILPSSVAHYCRWKGRAEKIAQCTPEWQERGKALRANRESRGLSKAAVARCLRVKVNKITRLEAGAPVRNAELLETAYRLLFEAIVGGKGEWWLELEGVDLVIHGSRGMELRVPCFDPTKIKVEESVKNRLAYRAWTYPILPIDEQHAILLILNIVWNPASPDRPPRHQLTLGTLGYWEVPQELAEALHS